MKKLEYAVTFEFLTDPPITERGIVAAGSWHTAASRAVSAARRARPSTRPSSLSILLMEPIVAENVKSSRVGAPKTALTWALPAGKGAHAG